MSYRIGIDVGGTNTDAVLLDGDLQVVAAIKTPTQVRSGDGVARAIERVLAVAKVPVEQIRVAMLGTTHCTNAIVERKGLSRVGVLRLGGPATTALPPFEGWPASLRAAVEGGSDIIHGGYEFDGRQISTLDEAAIVTACAKLRGLVDAVAVVGVFSPVNPAQEITAAKIVARELGVPVSCSAEIGSIGLLERENATILNAALIRSLSSMAEGFQHALTAHGIKADIFFGQNDGTLMRLDYALRYPVFTIGCGPTNSIRGAAHLSGVANALVVDIGGTTTDIGVLIDGFPRQSAHAAEIGGIRTNFRMPDVLSVGLGGGTVVRGNGTDTPVALGPDSVGYQIHSEARVFGGNTLTTTDIAVAAGRFTCEGATSLTLDNTLLKAAEAAIRSLLEESIDRMKPSAAAVPIVLVGGGSVIAPLALAGVSQVICPEYASAANAVGAALGDVAAQVEQVCSLQEMSREQAVSQACSEAIKRAIEAGAAPDTVEVLTVEELPVAYMDDTILIRARAAGRLLLR